jgi:hypothetical protein
MNWCKVISVFLFTGFGSELRVIMNDVRQSTPKTYYANAIINKQ